MALPSTPAHWDGSRWVVTSQSALTADQLRRIAEWLLPVQRQRRLGLSAGPVRDDLDAAIAALEAGRIVCGLAPDRSGERVPFSATVGAGRIISLGAA